MRRFRPFADDDLIAGFDPSRSLSFAFGTPLPVPHRPLRGPGAGGSRRWKAGGQATASALQELAWFLGELGDRAGAEALFRRAVAIREQASGPNHLDTASALQGLGWALRMQGKFQEFEPLPARTDVPVRGSRNDAQGSRRFRRPKDLIASPSPR
jgi:hypothetical protein